MWGRWVMALAIAASLASSSHVARSDPQVTALDDKLAADPDRIDWLLERAALHRLRGDFGAALADLNEAYELDPELPEVCLERGQVLAALGYPLAAESDLSLFLALRPDSVRALQVRGRLLSLMGQPARARADYEAALALAPTAALYLARCRLDEDSGKLDDAASCYSRGLGALRDAVVLRHALARVETERRNYGRAIAMLDALVDHPALRADALLDRADAYEQAGKELQALRDRQLAMEVIQRALERRTSPRFERLRDRAAWALGDADASDDEDVDDGPPDLDAARAALRPEP